MPTKMEEKKVPQFHSSNKNDGWTIGVAVAPPYNRRRGKNNII